MIIKKIELVNYCQHEHREIAVSGNLVAVVGHNGVGKSNMLGALQFALTGEQPDKNKADLLHWGAKEGHVTLEFEQDGKPGRIERSVSSNKVTLEYDGVVTSGITNVANEMETRLRMKKDLVKQSVFVRQTEVDAIISAKTDKREREVAFQKLIDFDAAKVHRVLTDWLYQATKPISYDIQLTEANRRLGELEARSFETAEAAEAAERAVAEFGEVDESQSANLSKAIAAVAAVLQAKAGRHACGTAVLTRAADYDRAKAQAESAGTNPGFDVAALAEQAAVLKDELRRLDAREAAEKAVEASQQAYVAATGAPCPSEADIATLAAEADAMQAELATIRSEKAIRIKSLNSLDGTESVCPVCGKPLDADMVEHLRGELAALNERERPLLSTLQAKQTELMIARETSGMWGQSVAVAESRLKTAQEALDRANADAPQLDRATATSALAKANADIQAQRDYDARAGALKEAVSQAELNLGVAKRAAEDADKRLEMAAAEARRLCGDEAAADWTQAKSTMESIVAETDRRRARHTELRMAAARAAATRDEVAKSLATLRETVASLKIAQAEQDELAARLHVSDRVKDWFHHNNGPRIIVTAVLGALTDDVNRFLGNFTAPFVVVPDPEQVGFRVQFTDGRDCPEEPPGTGVLSGGERVQLAVAFRLAIYGMFAGKLGLLSLDEPTAYLDDSNVDRFGVLLTKVREIARNMNTQVFLATHERAVIPHMDSVIDLN